MDEIDPILLHYIIKAMGVTENESSLVHIASLFLSPSFLISAFPCKELV